MDFSSDPANDPLGSSLLTNDSLDLGELPDRRFSPILLPTDLPTLPRPTVVDLEPSSDPITASTQIFTNSADPHRLSRNLTRKRGLSSRAPVNLPEAHTDKEPRTEPPS